MQLSSGKERRRCNVEEIVVALDVVTHCSFTPQHSVWFSVVIRKSREHTSDYVLQLIQISRFGLGKA